ncbi:MAG: response regulator transcription factor [Planctomycetes bacterium]|jgi:two-component system phosphate regulon response regulator PhoB|nr:response regulator transcription factor [Planctomycetota bacterium]
MTKEAILVIEDEEDILELEVYNLKKEGFRVSSAATGEEGLKAARAKLPDLILLDLMLPGADGLEVCRLLKRDPKTAHVPVVMVTAKGEESDVVAGLELGAEDYIAKPFSPRVLVARVKAVLRRRERREPGDDAVIQVREITIHPGRHEVLVKGKPVELTATEFRLLRLLASRPGWVFTRYQIVDGVHGEDYPVTDRSVDVAVVGLRRKLGPAGKSIETVRGVGYRFQE